MTQPPSPARADAPPPRRARGRESVGDMVRSLAAVLVLVGVVVAVNLAGQPDPVQEDVDLAGALVQARQQAPYDVLAPPTLPTGWRATSARTGHEGAAVTWHLGLVTASGSYAGVAQTDGGRAALLRRLAEGARPGAAVTLAGARWRRLEGGRPEPRALARTEAGVTTVVAGSAGWPDLERLAASLRP